MGICDFRCLSKNDMHDPTNNLTKKYQTNGLD